MKLNLLGLAALLFALIACGPTDSVDTAVVQAEVADTLYFDGSILTMVGNQPAYVEAVAVRDGKIIFAGSKSGALALQGPDTVMKDLGGKAMLPGFIDPHGHFMSALSMVQQVNVAAPPVGTATDIASIVQLLKDFQLTHDIAEGGWVIGWGYDQDQLAEQRHITKADLDPHFPNHKIMLIHVSMHGAVLNSNALAWAGVDASTETPGGGIINRMPDSNEPAGLLMETAYMPIFANMPQPSEKELLELMKPAQMLYARDGYTHAQEGFTHIKDMDFLQKAASEERIFLDITALPSFTEAPVWMNNPKYPFGEYHGGLKLQGIKFTQDGSPQGKTAFVSTPYLTGGPSGQKDWYGETTQPEEVFIEQVKKAFEAGLQVWIHANGDATIDQAIKAVDAAGIRASDNRRTVVVHSQFQHPEHLTRYAELGMSPTYFTNHVFFWGDVHVKNIGEEKAVFINPLKAATEQGLVYSNHTDFNVTPLDPFFIIWGAMTRETRSGVILGPDQRVDAYTALQGLTTGPAWQSFEENRKGSIKPGLLADFVILSVDPLAVSVDEIRSIRVLETIKEDKTIFQLE